MCFIIYAKCICTIFVLCIVIIWFIFSKQSPVLQKVKYIYFIISFSSNLFQILLGRSCPFLDTIVIRDQISSATLILLAHYCRNLSRLIVRKYAIIWKCDWPHNPDWTQPFYNWLRITSGSSQSTVTEISKLLETKWHPLSDEEFERFRL